MRAEIEIGGKGFGRVVLDGNDVSNGVRALQISSAVGEVPRLELDVVVVEDLRFDGEVRVVIPDATRETLEALGWTPPAAD
ncbi:hypothetical protein [Micromonospora sp. L32]|uniref:hypothetical protein n=1 Tax=Micromonospora sp. L32 TaxID=3452214 RepID=UPI003F8B9DA7